VHFNFGYLGALRERNYRDVTSFTHRSPWIPYFHLLTIRGHRGPSDYVLPALYFFIFHSFLGPRKFNMEFS
jgi:hypothetical protein